MKNSIRKALATKLQNLILGRKAILGQAEQSQGTGGSLVTESQVTSILNPSFAAGSIYELVTKQPVGPNADGVRLPYVTQESWGVSGTSGSAIAYWEGEGCDIDVSKATYGVKVQKLEKVVVVVPATFELLEDAEYVVESISEASGIALNFKLDNKILYGMTDNFAGILSAGSYATKFVTVNLSDTSAGILAALEGMAEWYYGGDKATWIISKSAWNQILPKINGEWHALINLENKKLLGYDYRIVNSLKGDTIVLGDFTQYGAGARDMYKAFDDGLEFLTAQRLFKTVVRAAGRPLWAGGVELDDGSVVYPFVANIASEQSSSSSHSSLSSASSASSESSSSSSSKSSASSPSSKSSASSESSSSSSSSIVP